MRTATVDTYDWSAGQPGVLEVWGATHGFSRPARFLGWLGGDPVFLIVKWDEMQTEEDARALDDVFQKGGVVRCSFAEQALPPSSAVLTLLDKVPRWTLLWSGKVSARDAGDLVVWVRSDLRWGSMLDEVLS